MWLTSSTIGRKFVMALTGICLVLFVTFHVLMNSVAIVWPTAYNEICRFLGANWYALVASMGLAVLFIIHIIYAVWLTVMNRKARGEDRYEVTSRPPQVEWSSKNMLVLGVVILAFLVVHLIQFWYRMQWQEVLSHNPQHWTTLNGVVAQPEFGTLFLQAAFSCLWTLVIYCIGFIALWFHMNHGFWSMFHSIGWDNNKWIERLKKISCAWTSVVVVLFVAQAIVFTCKAHSDNNYLTDPALQKQYEEFWAEQSEVLLNDYAVALNKIEISCPQERFKAINDFKENEAPKYKEQAEFILNGVNAQCPDAESVQIIEVQQLLRHLGGCPMGQGCGKPCDKPCGKGECHHGADCEHAGACPDCQPQAACPDCPNETETQE